MTEKRYITDTDCLMNVVLDTWLGFNGLDEPTEEEIMDKDFLVVCSVYSMTEAKKVCELLNKYEYENKELKYKYDEKCNEYCGLEEQVDDLLKENKELKAQLYCEDDVCVCCICKYQQLIPCKDMQRCYTAKCEKGHKKCGKEDVKHCEDFKLKELQE